MRVLHVIPSLDPATGGPARSVPALCDALQKSGALVSLFAMHPDGGELTVKPEEMAFHLRVFPTPLRTREFPSPRFGQALRRAAEDSDLVHINSLWNPVATLAAAVCRRVAVPYLVSPRGMLQCEALKRRGAAKWLYGALFEQRTLRGAAGFHFFTDHEARDSRHVPQGKPTFVIPSGIDTGLFETVRRNAFRSRYPVLRGRRVVLFLGRVHWSKGLDLQARAVAAVVRAIPECTWVVAGPDAGYGAELGSQIDRLGIRPNVLRTGPLPREQALEAIVDADAVVLSSRHEAHSTAMNEALTAGAPVVLTRSVSFRELEQAGAALITESEPFALADGIISVLTTPALAEELGRAARALANDTFSWPRVARRMMAAYESLGVRTPTTPCAA